MIELAIYMLIGLYVTGFLLLLGGGIAHEHGARDPEYHEVIDIAAFWPLFAAIAIFKVIAE